MMEHGKKCLTLVGTASIQDYLFRSNRLKENVGASYLVANVAQQFTGSSGDRKTIFQGGGNAAVIFESREKAIQAVFEWSKQLLEKCPGLRVTAAHEEYETNGLKAAYERAQQQLFFNEQAPPFGSQLGALPVARTCPETGLAADSVDRLGNWLSGEALAKQNAAINANIDLKARYQVKGEFPLEFDNLGQVAGEAQIAVVHIDGNAIGELFAEIEGDSDELFIEKVRGLSDQIKELATSTFRQTLAELSGIISTSTESLSEIRIFKKADYFPVRPIVDGGDDLTFVCQGRLGIPLAIRYLELFEQKSMSILKTKLTACAGVVIVHQAFPFSQAYQLAEALTDSAKRRRKSKGGNGSWIDFELVKEGSMGSLSNLREGLRGMHALSNVTSQFELLCRPYQLAPKGLDSFHSLMKHWRVMHNGWPRSLAKNCLEKLVDAPNEVQGVFSAAATRGHTIPQDCCIRFEDASSNPSIWRYPFYDALDLIDVLLELNWPTQEGKDYAHFATGD